MRNIVKIFKADLKGARRSVISVIVLLGLVIVPVLYAWFNIAGSWDPYGNTGNLKVAVANQDAGCESDLIPVKMSLGDSVTSTLRENHDLNWVFVDKDGAIEGVRSGEYYAAVVIPEDFSRSMMTLFSEDVHQAKIEYYENQKANAIAPRVTDKGASTVRQQIDETFASTVGDVGLAATSGMLEFMNGDEVANYVGNLSGMLGDGAGSLRQAASGVNSFARLLGSTSSLVDSIGTSLNGGKEDSAAQAASDLIADAKEGVEGLSGALDGSIAQIDRALQSGAKSFDGVSDAIDTVFEEAGDQAADTQGQLSDLAETVGTEAQKTEGIAEGLREIKDALPDNAFKPSLEAKLDGAIARVDGIARKQRDLQDRLSSAAEALGKNAAEAAGAHEEIKQIIAEAKAGVSGLKEDYDESLSGQLDGLAATAEGIAASGQGIAKDLDGATAALSDASESLADDLSGIKGVLSRAGRRLKASADDLLDLKGKLDRAVQTGDLDAIRGLIGDDPTALASALAAPVALDRTAVYHIENYGSAMAPFYTILSLWVGGIVLAAMMKVEVGEKLRQALRPYRLHELYLGRYAIFALLALAQGTLVCLGDIFFLGIQCEHPLQFIAAGWLASIVFSNIIYTLTVSFGDIGKAVAVVLLVMQVAGSGGTFPIEMTADFFQAVYPFLPFTHGINAMHAAMAGAFGAEFWTEMGLLASYLLPSLALGLLLRRPVIRANTWIIERLESTKLM